MSNLLRLLLCANNFTGIIPETYGNLKNLTQFRINGNTLSGKIPNFIGNWTKLDRLRICRAHPWTAQFLLSYLT
ncbi:hypothetical protein AAZV13_16G078700 [Glycine max]